MLNQDSLHPQHTSNLASCFVRPDYQAFCFSNISATIEQLMLGNVERTRLPASVLPGEGTGAKEARQVVVLFVDSFGWRFFNEFYPKMQQLQRMDCGVWSKLTAQFPSTTAAHVTNFHTGLTPAQSGVYEWYYYEPQVGEVIAPLLFASVSDSHGKVTRDSLLERNCSPEAVLPVSSFYNRLERGGVKSLIFGHQNYTPSSYGSAVMQGVTECKPFKGTRQGLLELAQILQINRERSLFYFYIDSFDSTCHTYGPESERAYGAAHDVFAALEECLFNSVKLGRGETLFMLIADHGHEQIDPAKTIYLDNELPELVGAMKCNSRGVPIAPCGSCRDLFLHVHEDHLPVMYERVANHLSGRAQVVYTEELNQQGYFGGVSSDVGAKLGNLAVLPLAGESVWLSLGGAFSNKYKGQHGGLTRNEMEVSFWSCWGHI